MSALSFAPFGVHSCPFPTPARPALLLNQSHGEHLSGSSRARGARRENPSSPHPNQSGRESGRQGMFFTSEAPA